MSVVAKLITKMKNQPNGIRYEEAVKVLTHYGYILVRKRGSHRHYRNDAGDLITIIEESPQKKVYIEDILNRIGE